MRRILAIETPNVKRPEALRSRAARLWRALWPVVVVAGGTLTCDSPTGPGRRMAQLSLAPVFSVNAVGQFAGLTVDQIRLTAVRPPSETLVTRTIPFPADSESVQADLPVAVTGTETLTVYIELLAGGQVMFSGSVSVEAAPGAIASQATPIPVSYQGPGSNIATLLVSPRDSGAAFGATAAFSVTARDASSNPVSNFYVGWSTSSTAHTINANGLFTAGTTRGAVWVRAHTPTGIWDSTRIVVAPVPSAVQVVSGGGQTGVTGAALGQPFVVQVIAADNGPVAGVRVNFAASSGGGSVNPASAVTDMQGQAQTMATLGATAGANTFSATVTGIAPASFSSTAISGTASQLAFTVHPSAAVAGVAIAPAIQVVAQNGSGITIATYSGAVTLAIAANPGSGTLAGTATASAVAGVATFSGLSINRSGTGYTLGASATGLSPATSLPFNIAAGSPTTLALVSGDNQAAAPGAALPSPVVVRVTDALGNGVSGRTVTFAVATGGGSVGTPSATTDASGNASSTWTLGAPLGAQTITVTSVGLGGSPITVTGNASSTAVASTTVTPQLDTIASINGTRALTATARNASNNIVAGSYTWVSRSPAFVTVSASGLATGVANGAAWVVATEAGGTRDSARIVVNQRIASINVIPGNRSIYLTRSFTFSAVAVDGGGTAIPVQPTFTWSSTAPAVATVDAAGLATGVGLGSTQIRATSGVVIGVSNVSVITAITRIAVVVDTAGAAVTDTFTLTSLGLTRTYRAFAHDTLDALMTGITFTWASSNGSVAVLDNVTGLTARATSAANGVTAIRATAQGFTSAPGAALTVAQALASIELTPPAATIAISGTVGMVARGRDANNRYISGGTFAFNSATPAVATVGAGDGRVTGVTDGTSNVTATSGAITSNAAVITVGGTVPAVISFGRDTLSVGRGSSASIPILLSRPHGTDLVVNLAVADTFAYFSQASVTIPSGQTSINATLNGRNAGSTSITAVDGSGAGYAGANAVLAVTATMRLTAAGYGINATDIVTTQVLLSDPSPVGGTYVTFGYSTPGIAAISPDPAFIPAGQLAADIQIRGLAAGSTNITPSAIGVNGTASSFTAYAPVLTPTTAFMRLGQGQYEPNQYVYTPTSTNVPVPVTFTSSDTNVVTVTNAATIPGGSNYAYFTVTAKAIGAATVTVSAPGWTAANSIAVVSTSPYIGVTGGTTLFTTSPIQNITVYAEDSVRNAHYRTNSLVVQLSSRDTTVMRVLDTLVAIAPGQYYTSAARVIPGGTGGSTYVVATASGHQPDSTLFTVVGPPLTLGWTANRIGAGQEDYSLYVYTPNNVPSALTVTLVNSDSNIVGTPVTVTIPSGTTTASFTVRGKVPGSVTITATAPGFQSDDATYTVTTPRVVMSAGYAINNFAAARGYTIYATDSIGNAHYRTTPLTVSLSSSDPAVVTTSATATIAAGQYYAVTAPVLTPVGIGSSQILATAPAHRADSTTYTIITPALTLAYTTYRLGARQHRNANELYVYTPDSRPVAVPVTLTRLHPAVESLTTTTPTVPINSNIAYYGFYGLVPGVDTVIATAAGYLPDTGVVIVTTPRLIASGIPGSLTTTNPPFGLNVYAADSVGNAHYASDTIVVRALTSDSAVIRPTQEFFHILKDAYYASPTVTVMGPGTASMTYSDSAGSGYLPATTNTVTVIGPALTLANGSPVLGMRQRGGTNTSYVYAPNAVTSPLVVNLVSTDPRVATVPASVTIPNGSNIAYFEVTALDTLGTIQIQASALGYTAANMNVQVTQPRFVVSTSGTLNTTSPRQAITVYAADANGTPHYTTENVTATLLSTAPSVASLDSTTVTILSGNYFHNTANWTPGIIGTSQLQASDQRAVQYQYATGAQNVAVVTPSLGFSWGSTPLGIGQYVDQYVYSANTPAAPLSVSLTHTGTARISTQVGGIDVNSVTIPTSTNLVFFRTVGTSTGTDTLVASASSPLHNPTTAYTVVGQGNVNGIGGWPTTLAVGDSVLLTMYARDPATNVRYVLAATPFTLTPNANIQFVSGGPASSVITTATIPADQYQVTFYLKAVSSGTGSVGITATSYQPYSNTVTVP